MPSFEPTESLEFLIPKEGVFKTSKVKIHYIAETNQGLDIESDGIVPFDPESGAKDLIEEMADRRYALRDFRRDQSGKVVCKTTETTMGLYKSFHRLNTPEDVKRLKDAMPVGCCVILLTKKDRYGIRTMVIQNRESQSEYQFTAGASAGGIMRSRYDNGKLMNIRDVIPIFARERVEAEMGVTSNQITLETIAYATETEPKTHGEIITRATTELTLEEIKEAFTLRTGKRPRHMIGLPVRKDIVETLVARLECPIPSSHLAAFIAVGYMQVMEDEGVDAAITWVKSLEEKVEQNYAHIDSLVATNTPGVGKQYDPEKSPRAQGLPDLNQALIDANLLVPVFSTQEILVQKEIVSPSEVCITGSLHFLEYLKNESSDKIKADLALEAIRNTLMDGYNMTIVISPATPLEYSEALQQMASEIGKGKLVLVKESGRTYSGARRQAADEALRLSPQYIVTCEIEKKELERFHQQFLRRFGQSDKKPGFVVMNRGIFKKLVGLPGAQDEGELHQNYSIMRHLISAGIYPEGTLPLDLLNGTRIVSNELLPTNAGIDINPVDLLKLTYQYEEVEIEENMVDSGNTGEVVRQTKWVTTDPGVNMTERYGDKPSLISYPVDHYSAAVYHSITMSAALGIGVEQVEVPYAHDAKQTAVEQGPEKEFFEKKRRAQDRAIIDQNFDLVANICEWKKLRLWPKVVTDAIENKTPISLKHYDSREWEIKDGILINKDERSNEAQPTTPTQ